MSTFSELTAFNYPLIASHFGEAAVYHAHSGMDINVECVFSEPKDQFRVADFDTALSEALLKIPAIELPGVTPSPGRDSVTVRGEDWSVKTADLGEGSIWRFGIVRSEDVAVGGRGFRA